MSSIPDPSQGALLTRRPQWGLLGAALLCAAPIIFLKIKDTITLEEDLKFSDETIEDVASTDVLRNEAKHAV